MKTFIINLNCKSLKSLKEVISVLKNTYHCSFIYENGKEDYLEFSAEFYNNSNFNIWDDYVKYNISHGYNPLKSLKTIKVYSFKK